MTRLFVSQSVSRSASQPVMLCQLCRFFTIYPKHFRDSCQVVTFFDCSKCSRIQFSVRFGECLGLFVVGF
jgi:hypothetical protein